MSNRRSELAEMTALYLIPIVAVVIAATSGGLVAGAIPNTQHQLWTLIISYIFWGIGSPLSWIILTIYFLRLTIHEPLKREVIVSLLLPIGPLALSGFSCVTPPSLFRVQQSCRHRMTHGTGSSLLESSPNAFSPWSMLYRTWRPQFMQATSFTLLGSFSESSYGASRSSGLLSPWS